MARPLRIKKNSDAHYHLMSRTNNKRFLFRDGALKTELVSALRRAAEFCGVHIKAYTAMDNHFHVVVKVTKPEEPVCASELLRRVGVLKGEREMRLLSEHWDELSSSGFEAGPRGVNRTCDIAKLAHEGTGVSDGTERVAGIGVSRYNSSVFADMDKLLFNYRPCGTILKINRVLRRKGKRETVF